MKEHHDDILQNVAQLSHQYNELQELLKTKQEMIVDQTTKTIDDVNHYFDIYITELRQTQQKIIEDLQVAKQDAQVMR
jgi:alpha/beta superfamily hydrolase